MAHPAAWLTAAFLILSPILAAGEEFKSASSISEVREQIGKLPRDDIWWTRNGRDMLWNNKNLHRIFPTVNVYRDGQVRMLPHALNRDIDNFKVETPSGSMRFVDFLDSDHSTSQGVVIAHKGQIVFEHYARMQPYEKPIFWSVTKMTVAAVISILEDRGLVDIDKPIDHYVPRLATSAYAGIAVRHILDMASGIDCSEEYVDKESCFYRFMASAGEGFWDENSPSDPYEYMANIEAPSFAPPGTSFEYGSINTDLLGWLVEEVTGMPFQDAFSREIWQHIGAESDASFLAPRYGYALVAGGLLARMRDVVRFGLLYTPSYTVVSDRRLISAAHVEMLLNEGNPELLKNGRWPGWTNDEIKHNVYQWDAIYTNNDMYKGGWAGQGLLVNPEKDLVAVFTGYFKDAEGSEMKQQAIIRSILKAVYP
jgi:CubicO group peptidase (beta-lactamase class C family)